jgi:hypothetical protein
MGHKLRSALLGVVLPLVGLIFMTVGTAPFLAAPAPMPQQNKPAAQSGTQKPPAKPRHPTHFDHNPKHGGIFFMSMDYKHHLEGVLLPPGTFRLYLYDDYTRPLKAEEIRKASGTVQIGDPEKAPKIALAPGKQMETMEAKLGNGVKFPVALTVLLRLPGMPANSKPELFNFVFKQFTQAAAAGGCTPMAGMSNMHC